MVIDRYIARSIFSGVTVSTLVIAALFAFINFVTELDNIGTANYHTLQALFYVALTLPQRLYDLAPSIIMIGALISLGAMASGSELVVMRASGVTSMRIVRSVMQTGMMLAVLVAISGETVVPYGANVGKSIRAHALDQHLLVSSQHGLWSRDNQRYVNARRVMPENKLGDVSVYELDASRQLIRTTHADRAEYKNGHWKMFNVVHSNLSADGVTSQHVASEVWPELISPGLFKVLRVLPEDMSAEDLYQYSRYMDRNGLDAVEYQLAFWIKIFTPFTCLAMLLIAMPLVFNTTPRSGGTGQRVIIGALLGIFFFVLNRATSHLGVVYGLPAIFSAAVPMMLVSVVSIVLLRRLK
jgi:lipopolysaccharide export system permease protein